MHSTRAPPSPPLPFTHSHPLPSSPKFPIIHTGLARPLWRLGPGGFCVVRVQRRWGVPKHRSGCRWLFRGGLGRLCFLHFDNQSIVLGVGGYIYTPPFNSARAHAQTGWLIPITNTHSPPPLSLFFLAPQNATVPSPGPPFQARSVRRCRKCTQQCHCRRERRRRPGQGQKV